VRVWTCTPERCRGTKWCPMAGWDQNGGDSNEGSPVGVPKTALATARRTGVTQAGFCIATERSTAGGKQ